MKTRPKTFFDKHFLMRTSHKEVVLGGEERPLYNAGEATLASTIALRKEGDVVILHSIPDDIVCTLRVQTYVTVARPTGTFATIKNRSHLCVWTKNRSKTSNSIHHLCKTPFFPLKNKRKNLAVCLEESQETSIVKP